MVRFKSRFDHNSIGSFRKWLWLLIHLSPFVLSCFVLIKAPQALIGHLFKSNHTWAIQTRRQQTNPSRSTQVALLFYCSPYTGLLSSTLTCWFTSQWNSSQLFSWSSTQIILLNCWPAFSIFMAWLAFLCSIRLCYSNVTMLLDLSSSLITTIRSEAIEMRPKVWTQALTNCTYLFFLLGVCTDISE